MNKPDPLSPPDTAPQQARQAWRSTWQTLLARQELNVSILLLLAGVALSFGTNTFLTSTNLLNVGVYVSWFAIAAFGVGLAIIVGGIDLSVASVMALAGLLCALALENGMPLSFAILLGLLSGALVGLLNGSLVSYYRLPPFIVTFGTMGLTRGLTLALTNGAPVRDLPPAFLEIGQGSIAVGSILLPLPVLWMLVIAIGVHCILRYTVLGRYIYTLGSDARALQEVGVKTNHIHLWAYVLSGILAACSGMLMTAKLGVASPLAASSYELDIIAAAVLGGASLFGGEGSIIGIVLATILMQIVRNGLVLMGLPSFWQSMAIGCMILLVILLDAWRRKRV
jgi:ribose transport system permease protein